MLLLAVACGNPHLTTLDGDGASFLPVIGTPKDLDQGPALLAKDGLNVKTTQPSITTPVAIQNLDAQKGWKVEYKLEKGEHFRIVGGSCDADIQAAENCDLNIEYFSTVPGINLDNVIVTYYREDNTSEKKTLKIPLRGERQGVAVVIEPRADILIKTPALKDELDFGKTLVSETPSGKAVIKNISDTDATLTLKIEKGQNFSIISNKCPPVLKAKEECIVDIAFSADKEGIYQDNLVATISDGKADISTNFPLMGEKYKDTPAPVRGPLVASEVLSKDVDFGKISVGKPVTKQIEIINKGSLSYNLKDLKLSNNAFALSGGKFPGLAGTCGDIILPGSCLIEVTFIPKAVGIDKGTLVLETKEGDKVNLNLVGEGDAVKQCETAKEYLVIPEKSFPASQVIFPYLKSHSSTTAKLVTLYGTEVNGYIKALNSYIVKNGMVYVTFKLPKMEGEIANIDLAVDVRKVIQDSFKDTESLCLSTKDIRRCSGQEFTLASWQKLKNPKFWDITDAPVNQRYEEQFVNNEKKCGSYDCMNLKTEYKLSKIFDLNKADLEVIRKDGTMTVIFSDDTRLLSMPRISVKTKVKSSCGI